MPAKSEGAHWRRGSRQVWHEMGDWTFYDFQIFLEATETHDDEAYEPVVFEAWFNLNESDLLTHSSFC